MELHERIAAHRKAAGLSLTHLARISGISRGYLHVLERGGNSPTIDIIEKLANAFQIAPGSLLIDNREGEMVCLSAEEYGLIAMYRNSNYAALLRVIAAKLDNA